MVLTSGHKDIVDECIRNEKTLRTEERLRDEKLKLKSLKLAEIKRTNHVTKLPEYLTDPTWTFDHSSKVLNGRR